MSNIYQKLFEGKFTTTYSHKNLSFFESLYYQISPSTYTERILYRYLSKAVEGIGKEKNSLKILDLGCGGGHEILTSFGRVWGIDISKESIKNAKKIYPQAIVGNITKKMPFPSNSFDLVFCSEVFGHIDRNDKEKFLKEIYRVLSPEGMLVMSAETAGDNWLTQLLKKKRLYKRYWIDYQGHIGLLSPENTLKTIREFFDNKKCPENLNMGFVH